MKQLTIGNKEILAVEVPSMAFGFDINNYGSESELMYMLDIEEITEACTTDETLITKPLPPGQWSIIARANEFTEEQARGLVGASSFANKSWINYEKLGYPYYTALESWQSFMKKEGLKDELIIVKQ